MSKKLRVIVTMVLCVILLVPATGLAAGEFDPSTPTNTTTNGTDGKEVIPVYGYIGEDTTIVDPDPENPEVPPETEIYMQVPVKIMFAAFESDAGAISSPQYTLTNLSTANDVMVEVNNFAQRSNPNVDLEGKLALNLTDYAGVSLVSGVFPATYPPAKLLKDVLPKKADGVTDNQLEFKVGGTWSGAFNKELQPAFDMTLKFSVV